MKFSQIVYSINKVMLKEKKLLWHHIFIIIISFCWIFDNFDAL